MWRSVFLIISVFLSLVFAGGYPNFHFDHEFKPMPNVNNDWWKTANFYQIYPRSFKDSSGNGVGDLKGITSKLSYLKEIGITATWLSPIFKSPMVDFGYDISNFYEIDELFGTMSDFDELIAEAKRIGVKIILDFVPNHSSDENEWFQKSIDRIDPYTDYYVWHKGKPNPKNKNGQNLPPSNWVSVFRGSAWTWNEKRKEYYLHQFAAGQPDFNYNNPAVRNEMKNVLKFWLDKGVDGFRIDAVPHCFECARDANGNFVDEPVREGATDPDDYGYLIHNCTVDQPKTLDLVYEWRAFIDEYQKNTNSETKVLLTEQWSPIDIAMQYYGNGKDKLGSHIPFNFFVIMDINNNTNARGYAETINKWLSRMNKDRIPNWVLGNHDKNRVGSRLGTDRIDMLNMMIMILPGAAITYQGEEIGMTDVWISWKDTVDPQACNSNEKVYDKLSRDPERTPFHWNNEKNAGFSVSNKTWLPMALNYHEINVQTEKQISRSKLNIYKKLRALRNDPILKDNFDAKVQALNDNVLAILRSHKDQYYVALMNINNGNETLNLKKTFPELPDLLEYAIVTDKSPRVNDELTSTNNIVLMPKEAVVLRSPGVSPLGLLDNYYRYKIIN